MKPVLIVLIVSLGSTSSGQDDVKDVPAEDLRAGKDDNKRYFLIGAPQKTPRKPLGLVLILPGGNGGAGFHTFAKRMWKHGLGKSYVAAQLVSKKWTPGQVIVWPTAKNKVTNMKFTTEDFVAAVIKDLSKRFKLDRKRIFTLTWSSSGPAAYAISLTDKTKVKGSFIVMSVFKPKFLPSLRKAKGHAYYLLHSPDDKRCPYRMAKQASKDLEKRGAKTRLVPYGGGHGWHMPVYPAIKKGIAWLEKSTG